MARQSHVGVKLESSYGVAESTLTHFSEVESESLERTPVFTDVAVQRSPNLAAKELMQDKTSGELVLQANYHDLGPWFKLLLGSADSTAAGSPYTHEFPDPTPGLVDTEGVSATVEVARDDPGTGVSTWRYAGCKVVSLALAGNLTDVCKATVGLLGKSENTGAITASPTFKDPDFLLQKDAKVSFDGGSTFVPMQSHNLRFEWPKDEPFAHDGSANPELLYTEPRQTDVCKVTGDVQVLFDDDEMNTYALVADGNTHDVRFLFTKGSWILNVQLVDCVVTTGTPHKDGRGRRLATFAFESVETDPAVALTNDDAGTGW